MPTYKDLLGPDGTENNMGGTRQFFFLGRWGDIKTFGQPAVAPADPDDAYVISSPHIMNSGCKFNTIYCTIDTSSLESGDNGETDGKSFKPVLKFFYPGSKKDAIAFANRCKNDKFVGLIPLADGTMIQLGGQFFCAYIKGNFNSTATSGRGKGWEFEMTCMQPDFMTYTAAVPLAAAV